MNKTEQYEETIAKIRSLLEGENDLIASMANISALLKTDFNWWWVGFYRVNGNELILGPFQGPPACIHIGKGRGVCGSAWQKEQTIVVPDVEEFPGHIACSAASKSEIVVPVFDNKRCVRAVLDVDSEQLRKFDDVDARYMAEICSLLTPLFKAE